MSKRGRPKLDRPRVDYGTPESIKRRMSISPSDPTQASCPLDILKVRKLISDEAHTAACYFRALRSAVFGSAHPSAIDLVGKGRGGSPPDETDLARYEAWYRDACGAMKAQCRQAFDAVENLVIHERLPEWLTERATIRNSIRSKYTMLGLAALLGWYKNRERKAA